MMCASQNIQPQALNNNFLKGFTLVELMVVLSIISILVAIAVPSYQSVSRKGQRVEGKLSRSAVKIKALSYRCA